MLLNLRGQIEMCKFPHPAIGLPFFFGYWLFVSMPRLVKKSMELELARPYSLVDLEKAVCHTTTIIEYCEKRNFYSLQRKGKDMLQSITTDEVVEAIIDSLDGLNRNSGGYQEGA